MATRLLAARRSRGLSPSAAKLLSGARRCRGGGAPKLRFGPAYSERPAEPRAREPLGSAGQIISSRPHERGSKVRPERGKSRNVLRAERDEAQVRFGAHRGAAGDRRAETP